MEEFEGLQQLHKITCQLAKASEISPHRDLMIAGVCLSMAL